MGAARWILLLLLLARAAILRLGYTTSTRLLESAPSPIKMQASESNWTHLSFRVAQRVSLVDAAADRTAIDHSNARFVSTSRNSTTD